MITGATRGIGRAIAESYAAEGANLALHCHVWDAEEDKLLKELRRKYAVKIDFFEAEFARLEEVRKMYQAVEKKFGSVDILVNNAATYLDGEFFKSTEKHWDYILDVNLKSIYFLSQMVVKKMLKGRGGNILNITSVAGVYPRKASLEYSISKAGLIHLTKSLALLLAPRIRVNAIAPSYTWSGLMPFMKNPLKVRKRVKMIPMKRFNDPEDIARMALFLVSEDARNITGQVMIVDGGRGPAVAS